MASRLAQHAQRYRKIAIRALADLERGDPHPETLHRVRTTLRRFQAYLELVGDDTHAQQIARCVSRLSRMRALQVFHLYLRKQGAPRSDLGAIERRLLKKHRHLARTQTYRSITETIRECRLSTVPIPDQWIAARFRTLRSRHAVVLKDLLAGSMQSPRRKRLHALRLRLKSVRYQEEWAAQQGDESGVLLKVLKRAQSVLGEYEERAEFRKLARKLKLRTLSAINKDWRRARKRARRMPAKLSTIVEQLVLHQRDVADLTPAQSVNADLQHG